MQASDVIPKQSYIWPKKEKAIITKIVDPGFMAISKGRVLRVFVDDLEPIKTLKRR